MDLNLVVVLVFLAKSSLQMPEKFLGEVNPASKNTQRRQFSSSDKDYSENVMRSEDFENMRKQMYLRPENQLLTRMFSGQNNPKSLSKREVDQDYKDEYDASKDFIEDRLIEQSQALGQLLKMARRNEEATELLVEHLSKQLQPPKLPEQLNEPNNTRRTNSRSKVGEKQAKDLGGFGRNMPKYGTLLKHLVTQELHAVDDPKPLLETPKSGEEALLSNRRSFNGQSVKKSISKENENVWCKNAILCHKTNDPLCGFDDSRGYAKFENLCHLFEVNCYWKYNFTIVSCNHRVKTNY